MTADGGCGGHSGMPAELRAMALQALDRLDPLLERVRSEPPTAAGATCAVCPLCAIIAALRGERPELAVRLAEQAVGLVAVLRAALEEGGPTQDPAPQDPAPQDPAAQPGSRVRTVHRIRVDRPASRNPTDRPGPRR